MDQRFANSLRECFQGWVTAETIDQGDASLAVLTQSHKFHQAFSEENHITCTSDWFKFNQEQVQWYLQKGCIPYTLSGLAPGDMVLWDSRTVHMGRGPQHGRPHKMRQRYVVYTSYLPRSLGNLKKKQKAMLEGRMTTHWACGPRLRLFGKNPRTWGKPCASTPPYHPPTLTERGARLFGFDSLLHWKEARLQAFKAWFAAPTTPLQTFIRKRSAKLIQKIVAKKILALDSGSSELICS